LNRCFRWLFAPSPLRGEGWDEEWFNSRLNATNPTPHLTSPPERGGIKPKPKTKSESVLLLPLIRGRLGGGIAENSVI
jgi:hypothetical protein